MSKPADEEEAGYATVKPISRNTGNSKKPGSYTGLQLQSMNSDGVYDVPDQENINETLPAQKTTAPNTKKTKALLISQAVIVVALLVVAALAVAALAVAASGSRCSCGEVQELRALLTSLTQDVVTVNSSVANLISEAAPQSSAIPYTPFENCTTSIEAECDIAPVTVAFSPLCATPSVALDVPGLYTVDVSCVYAGSGFDLNPLVGTARNDSSGVSCLCAVIVVNPQLIAQIRTITCGLQVTRCPTQQTIQLTTA